MEYSINLLWLNKEVAEHKYVYPGSCEKTLYDKYLYSAILWAEANPEGAVNIWYDSRLYIDIDSALENTKNELKGLKNLYLKDIWEINVVSKNEWVFDAEMPLYFRIDLLKMIIVHHEFLENKINYAIYSDLQVGDLIGPGEEKKRMTKDELFKEEWKEAMDSFGMLNNDGGLLENQFLIAKKDDDYIMQALQHTINCCLYIVEFTFDHAIDVSLDNNLDRLFNLPFYACIELRHQFYIGMKNNDIKVNENFMQMDNAQNADFVEWDLVVHGYQHFGNLPRFYGGISPKYAIFSDDKSEKSTIIPLRQRLCIESYKEAEENGEIYTISNKVINSRDGSDHKDTFGALNDILNKRKPVKFIDNQEAFADNLTDSLEYDYDKACQELRAIYIDQEGVEELHLTGELGAEDHV